MWLILEKALGIPNFKWHATETWELLRLFISLQSDSEEEILLCLKPAASCCRLKLSPATCSHAKAAKEEECKYTAMKY